MANFTIIPYGKRLFEMILASPFISNIHFGSAFEVFVMVDVTSYPVEPKTTPSN